MLIDIILDRKDGQAYNSRAFYNACMGYAQTFPCCLPVVRALDGGTEQDVISELCNYIQEQGYNPEICKYVASVKWLEDDAPAQTEEQHDGEIHYLVEETTKRKCFAFGLYVGRELKQLVTAGWWMNDNDAQRAAEGMVAAARLQYKTAGIGIYAKTADNTWRLYEARDCGDVHLRFCIHDTRFQGLQFVAPTYEEQRRALKNGTWHRYFGCDHLPVPQDTATAAA